VSPVHISVRLDNLLERIALVDHWPENSGLALLPQISQGLATQSGRTAVHGYALAVGHQGLCAVAHRLTALSLANCVENDVIAFVPIREALAGVVDNRSCSEGPHQLGVRSAAYACNVGPDIAG